MEYRNELLSQLMTRPSRGLTSSINDLREKEKSGIRLSLEEKTAVSNFERYRVTVLNAETDEDKFHLKYRQLQVIANLSDWNEFLGEDFF